MTRDTAAAEDLVQESLLRAWAARSQFQAGSNFRAWLFRIARNTFISGLRRDRRQVEWNPEIHEGLLASAPSQEEGFYRADFEKALQQLPVEQSEAFLLVTRECTPYALAADRLGIEHGTLKSRVARARAALRSQCLSDGFMERTSIAPLGHDDQPSDDAPTDLYKQWKASGRRMIG